MNRRTFFRCAAAAGAIATVGATASSSLAAQPAGRGPDADVDPLFFVTDDMSTGDVADILFEGAPEAERATYLEIVNSVYPNLSPREQLRSVLQSGERAGSTAEEPAPMAVPAIVAIAGRALIAAVRRYGPAMFRSLKNAVSRGYNAFNQWTKNNPFVAGIIGGVSSAALYEWLQANL